MIKKIFVAALPMVGVFIFDNAVNMPAGFYAWWWFDIFMHGLGGLVTAWSAHRFFKTEKNSIKSHWIYSWLLLGTTALVGILWEVYEYYLQQLTGIITQPSVADTVADLVNDCLGAVVFIVLFTVLVKSNKKHG